MSQDLLDALLSEEISQLSNAQKCYLSIYNSTNFDHRKTYIAWRLNDELIVPELMLRFQCAELTPYEFNDVEKDYNAWYVVTKKGDVFLNGSFLHCDDVHVVSKSKLSAKEAAIWIYFETFNT